MTGWTRGILPREDQDGGGIIGMATPPISDRFPVEDDVWMATSRSLLRLHREGWSRWTAKEGLPTPLLSVTFGLIRTLYLGTLGNGLHSWGGPQTSTRLDQVPEASVNLLRFGVNKTLQRPILIAGFGTPQKPTRNTLFTTLIGEPIGLGGPDPSNTLVPPSFVLDEPTLRGSEAWLQDVAFDLEGVPYIGLVARERNGILRSQFRRLEFFQSTNGQLRFHWATFSEITSPWTCMEYLPDEHGGGICIGTPWGLHHLNPSQKSDDTDFNISYPFLNFSIGRRVPVNDLLLDSRGWLWAPAGDRLRLYANDEWWVFEDPTEGTLADLNTIVENGLGDIYCARGDEFYRLRWSRHLGLGGVSDEAFDWYTEN